MNRSSNQLQYQHFPDGLVYPGHPVCIAFLIMLAYPNLESAKAKPSPEANYGNALSDMRIPGAGGNVHGALDLLKRATLLSPDAGFAFGEEYWRNCANGDNFGKNHDAGKAQAESIKQAFLDMAATWCVQKEEAAAAPAPSHF
jgi:hypothetical protein